MRTELTDVAVPRRAASFCRGGNTDSERHMAQFNEDTTQRFVRLRNGRLKGRSRSRRLEVGPFHLLPGYPGRVYPVGPYPFQRVGSDLNTRGYLDPAGNDATGTRVPADIRIPLLSCRPPVPYSFAIPLENLFTCG